MSELNDIMTVKLTREQCHFLIGLVAAEQVRCADSAARLPPAITDRLIERAVMCRGISEELRSARCYLDEGKPIDRGLS